MKNCNIIIPGNKKLTPAEMFTKMAAWSEANNVDFDVYGNGKTLAAFEKKIADLLGFDAAMFCITGTMTQPMALEMACEGKITNNVVMHPSSHILLHEHQNYQVQNRFNVLPVGAPYTTWDLSDLQHIQDPISAVLYELPMREIGGQLPEWDQLEKIKRHCKDNDIHLHMDGARLWESAAYYKQPYSEIAQGFDSVYVSLYKGINGIGGALLLGDKPFINKAKVWSRRQGGDVYHRTPYIVAAMMQFDDRINLMPALFNRTQWIVEELSKLPNIQVNPTKPMANMIHIYLPVSEKRALEIRDELADKHQVWFGNPRQAALPNQSYIEWYIGDHALNTPDIELKEALQLLSDSVI
ncbi:beta-eliminating lyase-related protein [Vibrio sp.]|nr:beta-eliminating lyase-related protein [Vibrio sp.]